MRPIKLGDDLSGKTIYLDLPKVLNENDCYQFRTLNSNGIGYCMHDSNCNLMLYRYVNQSAEYVYLNKCLQLNKTYIMPDDAGVVTYISDDNNISDFIRIDDENDVISGVCKNLGLEETLSKEQLPYFYIPRSEMLDYIYPVGSILENENKEFDPNAYYGGTWERIKGKVIVGVDEDDADFATAGNVVGEKMHVLSVNEIPSHGHSVVSSGNNHRLTINTGENSGSTYKISYDNASASNTGPFVNAANAGGGQAHNNVQPSYIAYIWRRVA